MTDKDLKERFEVHLWKLKSCWIWKGPKWHNRTYLFIEENGKRRRISARRISWEIYNKEKLSHDMMVRVSCEETFCVNPDHLYLVLRTFGSRQQ